MKIITAGLAIVVVALAGCLSGAPAKPATLPAAPSVALAAPSVPSSSKAQTGGPLTARQLVDKLKDAGLPIASIADVTAANDPNHLLGRPNGYSSKATFTDTRIKPGDVTDTSTGAIDLGGAIETYSSDADAKARGDYITAAQKAAPMLGTEYHYIVNGSLLRISGLLTPAQAQAYSAAASR